MGGALVIAGFLAFTGVAEGAALLKDGAGRLEWSTGSETGTNSLDLAQTSLPPSFVFTSHVEDTSVADGIGCGAARTVPHDEAIVCDSTGIPGIFLNLFNGPDTVRTGVCAACAGPTRPSVPMEIWGWGGDDDLQGGNGNDIIVGNSGDDTLDGKAGNDRIDLDAGAESDATAGPRDAGNDTLIGGLDNDSLNPGAGNDTMIPGLGDDGTIDGGAGTDTMSYDDGRTHGVTVTLDGGSAHGDGGVDDNANPAAREDVINTERLTGSDEADTLAGNSSANGINGLDGNDVINGNDGNDNIQGGNGDDILRASDGADIMNGNAGFDRADYSARTSTVNLSLNNSADDGSSLDGPAGARDNLQGIEWLIGGSGDDNLNATLLAAPATARLEGRDGKDSLQGSPRDDLLIGGLGADVIDGNADTVGPGDNGDIAAYNDHNTGVTISLANGTGGNDQDGAGDTIRETEGILGSPGNDSIDGDSGRNRINGDAGDDKIRGLLGTDNLSGGAGRDTVTYTERTASQPVKVSFDGVDNDGTGTENDSLSEFEVIEGGAGADTLSSVNVAGAELHGRSGDDQIFLPNGGGRGFGDDGNDKITGGNGDDVIDGGLGDDQINGLDGKDTLLGSDGNDTIEARDGAADTVDCGPGDSDTGLVDAIDTKANCELPLPVIVNPTVTPTPTPSATATPTPTPTPKKKKKKKKPKRMAAVVVFFHFPDDPTSTTLFDTFNLSNVSKGAKVVGKCLTKRGKPCGGGLKSSFKKKIKKKGKVKVTKFLGKQYPAGVKLEVVISKKGFFSQVKTVGIRSNREPTFVAKCQKPGAKKRINC